MRRDAGGLPIGFPHGVVTVAMIVIVMAHEREAQAPMRAGGRPLAELTAKPSGRARPGDGGLGLGHGDAIIHGGQVVTAAQSRRKT